MYTSVSVPSADEIFTARAVPRDDEAQLAATLQTTRGGEDSKARSRKGALGPARMGRRNGASARLHLVAEEMVRALESRLQGRILDLKVDVQDDQFVLHGVSSSYHVKQVAGHLAMNAMDAHLLGRLVNEIEVRATR